MLACQTGWRWRNGYSADHPALCLAGLDLPSLGQSLDFINIMTYDFHGAWDQAVNFHTPWQDPLVRRGDGRALTPQNKGQGGQPCITAGAAAAPQRSKWLNFLSCFLSTCTCHICFLQGGTLDIQNALDHYLGPNGQVPPR